MDSSLILSGQGMKDPNDAYDIMAASSQSIVMLDLTNNYLKDFDIAINFLNLKFLLLDNNMISSIQNFPIIPTLENLSLNNNSIKDSMQFVMSVSDKYPKLISINTLRNPMNPGFDQPEAYKRYKNTLKAITTLRMVDGMDINDQQTVDQIKYNNDMAKSTGGQKTMKTSMANFFSSKTTSKNPLESTAQKGSTQPAQAQQTQPKASMMSFFNASTIVSNDPPKVEVVQPKRIMYSIDESEEIDGTAYVKANKGRATIYFSEKQLKKSDNLTKFNRKNHSEGNKHILNAHL